MCQCQGNPDEYLERDIVRNVQFWFEHAYPNGITLRKKDAKLNMDRMAMARIEKRFIIISFKVILMNLWNSIKIIQCH